MGVTPCEQERNRTTSQLSQPQGSFVVKRMERVTIMVDAELISFYAVGQFFSIG